MHDAMMHCRTQCQCQCRIDRDYERISSPLSTRDSKIEEDAGKNNFHLSTFPLILFYHQGSVGADYCLIDLDVNDFPDRQCLLDQLAFTDPKSWQILNWLVTLELRPFCTSLLPSRLINLQNSALNHVTQHLRNVVTDTSLLGCHEYIFERNVYQV